MESKEKIRKEILTLLKEQQPVHRADKSRQIKEKLFLLKEFKKANNLMCYISLETEVDTKEIIKDALKLGKRVFTPFIKGDRLGIAEIKNLDEGLEKSQLGVLEPKNHGDCSSTTKLDMVILPGLAFDRKGNRLGRGKGYFDRFLVNLTKTTKKIALSFEFQILDTIPTNSHDIPIDLLVSN